MLRRLSSKWRFVVAAGVLSCCNLLCAQGIAISTKELPWAMKGESYDARIVTRVGGHCPDGDVSLSVASGDLPRGLTLFTYGIAGTPTRIGTYQFTLQASNTCGTVFRQMKLVVTGRPILLVSPRQITLYQVAGREEGSEDVLKVEASWPELPYTVKMLNPAPWLTVDPTEGKTPDPESALTGDRVRVVANAANLAPGIYHAKLKFYADGSENAPVVDVALQVRKAE